MLGMAMAFRTAPFSVRLVSDWSISVLQCLLNILNITQVRVTDLQGGREGMITTHMPIGPPFRPPPFSSNKACLGQAPPTSPPVWILLTGPS